jgi:hypothetical protein
MPVVASIVKGKGGALVTSGSTSKGLLKDLEAFGAGVAVGVVYNLFTAAVDVVTDLMTV